ncbi:SRPBCC family protein [Nocardioides sp. JQ2195]|uniref:SRPBCC family protein n=1 Tax=Nocardioides sp. JQ2195 TaxID=2592334 RepID=UPI00143E5DCF|nr:SRPBCC family protein [Nocardioides sp. JQ2195]QIX28498.1 SRPBCC family protein [Nocardioides sp. JQ2195]
MSDVKPLIEESIEIDATPEAVWALVTDLPRMASWSPQVVKTIVRGDGISLGTRAVNINRRGFLVWPTRSKVVRLAPHTDFAFQVLDNNSVWSFQLEPTTAGTRVTQRREAPNGTTRISSVLVDKVLGGQDTFQSELRDGMRQTLRRIKADAER